MNGRTVVDAGTSGGIWGLELGYCMMVGGEREIIERLDPVQGERLPLRFEAHARDDPDGYDAREGREQPDEGAAEREDLGAAGERGRAVPGEEHREQHARAGEPETWP